MNRSGKGKPTKRASCRNGYMVFMKVTFHREDIPRQLPQKNLQFWRSLKAPRYIPPTVSQTGPTRAIRISHHFSHLRSSMIVRIHCVFSFRMEFPKPPISASIDIHFQNFFRFKGDKILSDCIFIPVIIISYIDSHLFVFPRARRGMRGGPFSKTVP